MIQSRPAMSSDVVTGKPMTIVSTTVTFTSQSAGSSYGTATAPYDRICNVCHTYNPTNPSKMVHYTTTTSDYHNSGTVCTSCDKHSGDTTNDGNAFKGGGCTGCHSAAGGPTPGSTPDTYHAMHGTIAVPDNATYGTYSWFVFNHNGGTPQMGCGMCHPSSNTNHTAGTITPVSGVALYFAPTDTGAGFPKTYNAATQSYIQTPGVSVTCSSVYCHSNGYSPSGNAANRDVTYVTTPNWYGGQVAPDNCAVCHQNSPTGSSSHGVHVVGIHYDDLYNGNTALMSAGNTGTASHGNATTSTTINCNMCHSLTVSTYSNDKNTVCVTCHTGGIAKGNMVLAPTTTYHINGQPDISFGAIQVKSRAQIRNNITNVPDVTRNWTRSGATGTDYKISGSYDQARSTLSATAFYNSANHTCSNVACHNASSLTDSVWWYQPATVTCNSCHSTLP